MPTVKIGVRHQVTIPKEIFKTLDLKPGDWLEVDVVGGKIVLAPTQLVPKDETWFWTKEWQERTREALEDLKAGRVYGPFEEAEDLIESLREETP